MGISQSCDDYVVVGEAHLYHFGNVKILQRGHESSQIFKHTYQFLMETSTHSQFVTHLKKTNNICPYLMQIKQIAVKSQNYCSSAARFDVYFEYFSTSLAHLLKGREKPFTQNQVLRIFQCLLSAVKHLNEKQSYHGDISPEYIYVDLVTKTEYTFKIFDSSYFKPLKNGYYRAQEEKVYLAPEILANLGEKRTFPLYNHHLADTFSIGLIILYCMSLTDPLGAYNYKLYQIDFYYIQSLIRIAERTGYSQRLISAVRECLKLRNRSTASQILGKFGDLLSAKSNGKGQKFSLKRENSKIFMEKI